MNQQAHPVEIIKNTIKAPEMQEILKGSLQNPQSLAKFTAAAVAAITVAPKVFEDCDKASIYNSIVDAARRGLIPDNKQGALVPFSVKQKGENGQEYWVKRCQFMIMPQGIIDSGARNGIDIYAASVHQNDTVKFWNDGEGQHVDHQFDPFADRGPRLGAYAVGKLRTGTLIIEVVNLDTIKRVMANSKQKDKNGNPYGPWKDWPERMEQKTALHRLCKRLPQVQIDDDEEYRDGVTAGDLALAPVGLGSGVPEPEPAKAPTRPKALQKIVDEYDLNTGEILSKPAEPVERRASQANHQMGGEGAIEQDGEPF